jgi:hypothetical protein
MNVTDRHSQEKATPRPGKTYLPGPPLGETRLPGRLLRRWMIHCDSPRTTSVPLRPFGGTCSSGPSFRRDVHVTSAFGGMCLSRPPFDVGSSIPFRRGLKSRAESGAKAPRSMECGDLSPLFDEGFSLHRLVICGVLPQPRKRPTGRGDSRIAPTAHSSFGAPIAPNRKWE